MDYRVATALRGPDHRGDGPAYWKHFVTSGVRWLAAEAAKQDPYEWCAGRIADPDRIVEELQDRDWSHPWLVKAREWAATEDAEHARRHAREALQCLGDDYDLPKRLCDRAKRYLQTLTELGLV